MRHLTLAGAALVAVALSGCAYKPLDAPCSMSEGGAPTAVERPAIEPAAPQQNAVQALSYAEPERRRAPVPFSSAMSDCGPLRPINAGTFQ
jgi:hypothetical protein